MGAFTAGYGSCLAACNFNLFFLKMTYYFILKQESTATYITYITYSTSTVTYTTYSNNIATYTTTISISTTFFIADSHLHWNMKKKLVTFQH